MDYSLSLQWTLNETSDHFLKVGKDLVHAATSDSVQPIALLACEQFGATIAICPHTRTKIERLIKSQTSHVIVEYLKAKVDFAKDGSIVQLSRSLAGVNFLALASALVSTTDNYEAGTALENMIVASAKDKSLVPTAFQLKDLLDVLEPRLNQAGFLTDVLGWKEWWVKTMEISDQERVNLISSGETFPNAEGLHKIVTALRDACRVGEAKSVRFTARCGAPWLTAFVTWCLGVPPKIIGPHGQVLLESALQIDITYSEHQKFDLEIQIEVVNMFNNFIDVISASLAHPEGNKPHLALGMTTIQVYAKNILIRLGLDSGLANRALLQALPYALKQVRDLCMCGKEPDIAPVKVSTTALRANAFPPETTIAMVMAMYLSLDESMKLKKLDEGVLIADLPLVRLLTKQDGDDTSKGLDDFESKLSKVAADILALSLFDGCLDSMLLYYSLGSDDPERDEFANKLEEIWDGRHVGRCDVKIILDWALKLLNHDNFMELRNRQWIGSSSRGQVIFPKVFEDQSLRKNGYLELFCLQGTLTLPEHGSRPILSVKSGAERTPGSVDMDLRTVPVVPSFKLFADERLFWQVQMSKDCLLASIGWSRFLLKVNPFWILEILTGAIFVDSCPHRLDGSLDQSFLECRYILPMAKPPNHRTGPNESAIGIIPVGTKGICMLTLALLANQHDPATLKLLIGQGSCLTCLLDQAHLAECQYIVF